MSNTETEKSGNKPIFRLLLLTLLLTLFYLAANYPVLSPGTLANIAGWIYNTLPLDQVFLTISGTPLNVVVGFVLQLLFLWLVARIRYNITERRVKGESIFKNKLDLFVSCQIWALVLRWFSIVCDPMMAVTNWGGYAAELTHYLLEVYTLGETTLVTAASLLWLLSMILMTFGVWMGVIYIFERIIAKIKGKWAAKKTKAKAKESTRQNTQTGAAQKKDAGTRQAKEKEKTREKAKATTKPRSGVSSIDLYAASAADERLKKYMNSNVPVELQPCIRLKLLSSSDAMDMEMIRPFQPDGSLFMSLDCGSFTYEMAFRLDDKGNAYILGNQDEPLSPNAPHAACSKIDGKSVPQILIEYIKV